MAISGQYPTTVELTVTCTTPCKFSLETHLQEEVLMSWHSASLEVMGCHTSGEVEICAPDWQVRAKCR